MYGKVLSLIRVIILTTTAILVAWLSLNQNQTELPIDQASTPQTAQVVTEPPPAFDQQAPHPVSLAALAKKNFNGGSLSLGEIQDNNQSYTRYTITYQSGELTISGIMNVPKGHGPFPVLILNHGYIDPTVYTNGRGLRREQDYLAKQGYVVLHPDYRNHAFSTKTEDDHLSLRLGYTEDVINAVYAIKNSELAFLDKNNIGMLGHSMGGGITLNVLVTKPELVKSAVLFAPVSADYRDNFERWTRSRSTEAQDIIAAYGEPTINQEFWQNISPMNFLEKIRAPILLHHGTADESVPIEWSNRLDQALRTHNKTITYYTYNDQPHEFTSDWSLVMRRTLDFFNSTLKNQQ